MKNASQIHIKGTLHLLGGAAGAFTGRKNTLPEAAIKERLLSSMIKNEHEILNYDITLPDLSSKLSRAIHPKGFGGSEEGIGSDEEGVGEFGLELEN